MTEPKRLGIFPPVESDYINSNRRDMNDKDTKPADDNPPTESLDPAQLAKVMAMLGRSGGRSTSDRKAKAARANGRKRRKAAKVARRITRRNSK